MCGGKALDPNKKHCLVAFLCYCYRNNHDLIDWPAKPLGRLKLGVVTSLVTLVNLPKCVHIGKKTRIKESEFGDLSGGPVAKTVSFQCRGLEFEPRLGSWILHSTGLICHN